MRTIILKALLGILTFILSCSDDIKTLSNEAPRISDQTFSVMEDAGIGIAIGTVEALDPEGDFLTFSFLETTADQKFKIDSLTGDIILISLLNFNERSTYSLRTKVSDGLLSEEATLTIKVTRSEATILVPAFPGITFFDGVLEDADYWSFQPEILSAGMGFCDIVGIDVDEITEELVMQIGGAWASNINCGVDNAGFNTFTNTRDNLEAVFIVRDPYRGEFKDGAIGLDALPMTLSWPVVTSTLDLSDFKISVSNGEEMVPSSVGVFPNVEVNERNTIVLAGEFGNKKPSSDPNSRYVTKVEIVGELMLLGPNGQEFNAKGLYKENFFSPYDQNKGPYLVGAKLNYCDPNTAEGLSLPLPQPANDEYALYGDILASADSNGQVSCRLRVLTSGGFSPDGVRGVLPTDYEKFFRVHATGTEGTSVLLSEENVEYSVQGGKLKVIGLSDLGGKEGVNGVVYDDCYNEDGDNYIDIILVGDDAAMRNITHIEIPSLEGGYSAFYNPGGPGPTPYSGVNYTAPGPPDLEPVLIALDNPMRVSN